MRARARARTFLQTRDRCLRYRALTNKKNSQKCYQVCTRTVTSRLPVSLLRSACSSLPRDVISLLFCASSSATPLFFLLPSSSVFFFTSFFLLCGVCFATSFSRASLHRVAAHCSKTQSGLDGARGREGRTRGGERREEREREREK